MAKDGSINLAILRGQSHYQINLPLRPEEPLEGVFALTAAVKKRPLDAKVSDRDVTFLKNKAKQDRNKIADIDYSKVPVVDINERTIPIVDVNGHPRAQTGLERLATYNVELIIDRTGSMALVDGTQPYTKFEWCHQQVKDLADRLRPLQKTLSITTFNTTFQRFENCDPAKVEQIYAEVTPDGNTDLVDPLMSRLDAAAAIWQRGSKKTLIAVIHDGLPNVPRDTTVVDRAIIDYTKRMRDPNEVVITFLQIGDTFDGQGFCERLDNNLVNEGARYDIVETVTFPVLRAKGLVNALIDAVLKTEVVTKP